MDITAVLLPARTRARRRGPRRLQSRPRTGSFLTIYYRNLLQYAERHHRPQLGAIRVGLTLSLRGRALLRPVNRSAYLEALRKLRRARNKEQGPGGNQKS